MSLFNHILLLGPPASGKGTQAKRLSQLLGVPTLGTGNLLRQAIEEGSRLGIEASAYLDKGLYVPDSLIESLVEDWASRHRQGWVFDGFPRTIGQAEFINDSEVIAMPNLVIGFSVPREELERRINSRRQCRKCDIVTNTFVHPLVRCPDENCDGELYARNDDVLESFNVRYGQYREFTAPLFDYYREMGILAEINGAQAPDKVFEDIQQVIDERIKNVG